MKQPHPITIVLVDNHEIVRKGVRAFLDTQYDFEVVGETDSGCEALEMVCRLIPNVVLLEIILPDMDGVEVIRNIKKISPQTQVVVLTSFLGDKYCFLAVKAGVVSYLLKDIRMDRLGDALRGAVRGEATLHPQIAAQFLQYVRGEPNNDTLYLTILTNRELDVLKLIAGGMTNHGIAERLSISENTVKGHVSNIRTKLQIDDRVRLAIYAWERGIIHKGELVSN